jgi:hypothetical protein
MIWNPSKSAGANSETPNHAFAPRAVKVYCRNCPCQAQAKKLFFPL